MRAQFGETIGWIGKGIAILILLGTVFFVFVFNSNDRFVQVTAGEYWMTIIVGCASAALVFIIAQALRYILIRAK